MPDQLVSPLAGVAYDVRASDLSRFVADPADEAIAAVVHQANGLSEDERAVLRSQLDDGDCYKLLTFASRRSVAAIRDRSRAHAKDAVDALSLVTASKIDPRDLSVDFPLYAVHRVAGDPSAVIAEAQARSEPGVRSAVKARAGDAGRITLNDCGLREVTSAYGLGFMETWAEAYRPRLDLAGIAIRMADRIDEAGRYLVTEVHLSSLPGVWFGYPAHKNVARVRGCVSFAAPVGGGQRFLADELLAFVAEVDDPSVAVSLVESARATSTSARPQVAGSRGSVLLLLIGGPAAYGREPLGTEGALRVILDELLNVVEARS